MQQFTLRAGVTAVAILIASMAGVAIAASIAVTIDNVTYSGSTTKWEYDSSAFPVTEYVEGTATLSNPNINNTTITLYVNDTPVHTTVLTGLGNDSSTNFSLPWTISGPDTYNLKVTATRPNNNTGEAETVVEITELTVPPVVVTECPAAPAVAAKLLKQHNTKPKAASNYISQVAKQMGPQTEFNGVGACDKSAYQNAVDSYLKSLQAY